jgi:hypothetical protein
MCIDVEDRKIFLFGGWNGTRDLNDLWCYDIERQTWTLLQENTAEYVDVDACVDTSG